MKPKGKKPLEEKRPQIQRMSHLDSDSWRSKAPGHVIESMSPREIERQEVIYELFLTEKRHNLLISELLSVNFFPLTLLRF